MHPRVKLILVLCLGLFSVWTILPLEKKINLGLDLRGGIDLIYEVDVETLRGHSLQRRAENLRLGLKKEGVNSVDLKSLPEDAEIPTRISIKVNDTGADALTKASAALQSGPDDLIVVRKLDPNSWELSINEKNIQAQIKDSAAKAVEVVRNRVDQLGLKEVAVAVQGEDQIRVQLPGIDDPARAVEIVGSTAQLEFRLVKRSAGSLADKVGPDEQIFPTRKASEHTPYYVLEKNILLTGDALVDAHTTFDQIGKMAVTMQFNHEGAERFWEITKNHVKEQIAIVLDGQVQSAPSVNEPIPGGNAIITGQFTEEQAHDLAIILRSGALPAPIKNASKNLVGPSLGQESIQKGVWSAIAGAILIVAFMLFHFRLSGLFASVALSMNLLLLLAGLALLGGSLTLPGIAGIALTLGMAVDANVLIFERIKEELRAGKTVRAGIEAGFDRAWITIWDSNFTTLISAVALFYFGTGPIKGFATTLSMGIIISLFTAISVTKVFLDLWVSGRTVKSLSI